MSELFRPISTEQLAAWLFAELAGRNSIFGIPRQHFFIPNPDDVFRTTVFGQPLETPFGPAAGPHTQMAQNIVASWLCGARYIELKTVQTLDVLDVSKPCIDMQDEGYNVEWSQELKVFQAYDEYLRAWVLIHALHHKLGFPGASPGVAFNLSVGYDLAGIRRPNVQWFLEQMRDCSNYKQSVIDQIAPHYPDVRGIEIPDCIANNVTLSTMHGCPPGEIERIGQYLMQEQRLHTMIKCNPTLLGPERVRTLIKRDLGYTDIVVPDAAFEHDLNYRDAVPMFNALRGVAASCGLEFGVKLSNTLEVENLRPVFDAEEKTSYLSGRPLHAITTNLANRLSEEFDGNLPMSFSAGASCLNIPDLLGAGMQTITVCSDLLKTGGYLRFLDYIDAVNTSFARAGAASIREFILLSAERNNNVNAAARRNLQRYAQASPHDPNNRKGEFDTSHTKTSRELNAFDCIEAPCVDECPLNQKVPQYMNAVRQSDVSRARQIIRSDNPLPCILGRVCDHLCERACVRTHLDEPLAIRDIKRFAMDSAMPGRPDKVPASGKRVAIIGAGPGGMAAALELARAGVAVEIFEQHPYAGGMVGGAVPEYRLPQAIFDRDFSVLEALGVKMHFNKRVGQQLQLSDLRRSGFEHIVITVGAQRSKMLSIEGEDCDGVVDALTFLRQSREDRALTIGERVGVIGAGDTAMDCARVARRQDSREVTLIYRRTVDQMPADREELTQLIDEGVSVIELAKPQALVVEDGRLQALRCRRTSYARDRDAAGRKIPHEVSDSDFDVPLDTLILAISQNAVLDFFDSEPIEVNERGYIRVNPVTFETSVPGVYAGGDVANDGPASIVKAAAAGKSIADSILGRTASETDAPVLQAVDVAALLRRKSKRAPRVKAPQIPVEDRGNFAEVTLTLSEQQARTEAARCLDCDSFCSICVGVCPNLALQTYETTPFDVCLPTLRFENGELHIQPGDAYRVRQPYQVAVLTDLCNECGNCTTFCPTSGRPYRDKPRLYLDARDFAQQQHNAFMLSRNSDHWALDGRWNGENHRIELDGRLNYIAPALRASINPLTFEIENAEASGGDTTFSLEACAEMFVLLKGMRQSMPFLPSAIPESLAAKGRIAHPGYEE